MAGRIVNLLRPIARDLRPTHGAQLLDSFSQQSVTTSISSSVAPLYPVSAPFDPLQAAATEYSSSSAPKSFEKLSSFTSHITGTHATSVFKRG